MTAPSLDSRVNRLLLLRIGVAVMVLSAVFTVIAVVTERQRIADEVIGIARLQALRFNQQALGLLDDPDAISIQLMQQELTAYSNSFGGVGPADGRFVVARVYDLHNHELARLTDPSYPQIKVVESAMDSIGHVLPADLEFEVVSTRLSSEPYVGVRVPLTNAAGVRVAHIEGVFALSRAGISRVRGNMLRTVLYVIGIILITAAVIYPVIGNLIGRLARQASNLLDANLQTMQVLGSAIAKRDSDTDAHNYRVTIFSVRLAEASGLTNEQIRRLIKGALLHDVGKLGIRDNVLLKPGKLDEAEFTIMKTHVGHGLDITGRASWLADAQDVVAAHHEKFDGAGYPKGLKGEAIPLGARIFAIVDVFDALTSKRPYKDPFSFEKTMEILHSGRATHFDPELLDRFALIARDLYDQYSGERQDKPQQQVDQIIQKYFHRDLAELLG